MTEFSYLIQMGLAMSRMKPAELARQTGLSREVIRHYQMGYCVPDVKNLCLITTILGLDYTLEERFESACAPAIPRRQELTSQEEKLLNILVSAGANLSQHRHRFFCSYKTVCQRAGEIARAKKPKKYATYADMKRNIVSDKRKYAKHFSNTLLRASALDGLSLTEMANKADIPVSSMYAYVSESVTPSDKRFRKLITCLGIDHLRIL